MDVESAHAWDISLEEARDLQKRLSQQVEIRHLSSKIDRVGGFDISYLKDDNVLIAGMVVIDYPSLALVDHFTLTDQIYFPYIPGYLSFREAPVLLKLIEKYHHRVDIFMFDGHGIAHPRGLGIASHIGVLCDKPSIGCAKKRLVGTYDMPHQKKGSVTKLMYKEKAVGSVLRTRQNVKPVFISVGHKITLEEATKFSMNCTTKYRLPEPTRLAHNTVSMFRREYLSNKVYF